MERLFSRRKKFQISILALSVAMVFAPGPLYSDDQSSTTLTVQVQPEVYMVGDAGASWTADGGLQRLPIQLKVMIRINDGTIGELSISLYDVAGPSVSPLEVETEGGMRWISDTPVVLRRYSGSGIYYEEVMIQRPFSEGNDPLPSSLVLRLTSSDGATAGSRIITLPPVVPLAQ